MGMNNCFTFLLSWDASVYGHKPWSHDMAGKAKYFSCCFTIPQQIRKKQFDPSCLNSHDCDLVSSDNVELQYAFQTLCCSTLR
ncbi:hypothetical protein AUEXF2481DRAFT_36745 [Aureobasidium subglaciale EXF-2481]|uniref:Uncharacterized protein n=1 Tax=Aureobasidium subglaciale (strain EXF-2481) TaxID=1043005 RepID=A0A074YVP5_AURSE|nr:uncharacterized protein AUEXF2481DRAFT_36745 [Aureobasidium subglaciale EXF-2481]KEQ98232.1 hypothetical protein AUEXF2481DRAFT_36745 [Aureobasidium subglaciale EXF-2481]